MWSVLAFLAFVVAGGFAGLWWRQRRDWLEARRTLAGTREELATLRTAAALAEPEAEARLQALFNSMGEGVLLLDERGRVQLANDAFRRLFGVTSDVRDRTVLETVRLSEVQEIVARARDQGPVRGHEMELPGLDRRCLQLSAALIQNGGGRSRGVIVVFHDLTAQKRLETARKEFVANVSHELRTPLSVIKGYVETLIDGARNDPAVQLRFLQTIARHADRLTYLIEDLLTLSQLESGGIALNLQRVDLRTQAARVAEDFAVRAAERQMRVTNQVPDGLVARADADRLQQVLVNLVDNGIKYGQRGSELLIGARPLAEETLEVWVHNDGPGIPPDALSRVFERFYRVDKARSREQGGTGLGLAIVKHIVQSHGGEVRVESLPDRGATFFFTLPRSEGPAVTATKMVGD
jgi:two-component system phosphate regulon sensor histidine kinase PhoR